MNAWFPALAALGLAAGGLLAVQSRRLARARVIAARSPRAFICERPPGGRRIVLLGDSTGVGVGCRSHEESIAARLAREHPQARVTNLCVSGARVADVRGAAEALPDEPIDLAIVLAGGKMCCAGPRWTG